MGSYIAQSDIESCFGATNIARWSNLDNVTVTADTARISIAIAVAEDHVENRFRDGKYLLPFVSRGGILYKVKDWCSKLAGIWLYEHRGLSDENEEGNLLEAMRKNVEKEMDKYLAGEATLNAELAEAGSAGAPVVV